MEFIVQLDQTKSLFGLSPTLTIYNTYNKSNGQRTVQNPLQNNYTDYQ